MSNLIKPPNDGGPAFPLNNFTYPNGQTEIGFNGMTLRDWFAGQALNGYVAYSHPDSICGTFVEETAALAYQYADAMLKARKAKP